MWLSHAVSDEALRGRFDRPGDDAGPVHYVLPVDDLGQLGPLVLAGLPEARAREPEVDQVFAPFLTQEAPEQVGAILVVQERVKRLGPLQVRRSRRRRALRLVAQVQVGPAWGCGRRGGGSVTRRVSHFRRGISLGLGQAAQTAVARLDRRVQISALLAGNWRPGGIFGEVRGAVQRGHDASAAPVPDPM